MERDGKLKVYCETSYWSYLWDKMTPMEEIYAIRKEIAEENGYELDRIFEAARNSQRRAEAEGRVFVKLPITQPRKPEIPVQEFTLA